MTDSAPTTDQASRKTILIAMAAALAGAVVILVLFVLPAEVGVDPLGTGRLFGLTGLAEPPGRTATLTAQDQSLRSDAVAFELAPFESVEYKYELADGAAMAFSWSAPGPVYFDMHSEPEGAEEGFAETFATGTADHADGVYIAPFAGIHGWFWENRGGEPVTVALSTAGFYTGAITFRDGGQERRAIPAAE
jgi:hypothetical protein